MLAEGQGWRGGAQRRLQVCVVAVVGLEREWVFVERLPGECVKVSVPFLEFVHTEVVKLGANFWVVGC